MIARKSALIIATNILNGILGYVALFFITRYMAPADYGIVAFAIGFVTLFSVFGKLGFEQAHIKRVSEGKDIGTCIGTYLTTKIVIIGLTIFVVLGVIFFWKFVIGRGFETPTHELAIYIIIGFFAARLFAQSIASTFKAKKEIAKVRTPLLLGELTRVVFTIYVALAGYGALALAATYFAGEVVHFLLGLFLFRKYPIKRPSRDCFKDYSKFAIPLIVVVTCSTIMTNIDKVLIQLFWSAADVGYYFAGFNLSRFINMFTMAIGTLLFPTFSILHTNKNIKRIRQLTFQSERYLSMIVFPMVFGIVVLAEPTSRILLSGWIPSVPILQILPFFVLLSALERPYQSQFLGMNRPKLARNRVVIMVIFNVILNIILIPKDIQMFGLNLGGLGAKGAAIATAVSYGVGLVYSRIMAWKLTQIKGNPRILLHALSAILMAAIIYILLYWLDIIELIKRWYHLLGISFLGLGIYLGFMFIFKEFTKDDFYFLIDTLNIKKMFIYIKEELMGGEK
ncbi:MAG: flippase [Elusimicrobiota bacterium]